MSHAKYHWTRNFVFDDMDVMHSLPGYLRRDVGNCLSEKYFCNLEIFQDLSPYIRGLIALRLRCVSCNSDYELFHSQQYGKELFIQRSGVSYLLDNNKKLHQIKRGGVIGYFALLNPVRQTTLKCSSWCEFYALDRDDIQDILRTNFPRAWRPLWLKIKGRIKNLFDRKEATLNINIKREINFIDNKKNINIPMDTFDEKQIPTIIPKSTPKFSDSSMYNTSTGSIHSMDSEQGKKRFIKLRTFSMRKLSSENAMVGKTVSKTMHVAKSAKTSTERKLKKLLHVSDSEMRNDKVLSKPPIKRRLKNKRYQFRYEKKLKWKMMKDRKKREMRGVDEIIPKFNNNKPIINYFGNIINEENIELENIESGNENSYSSQDLYDDSSYNNNGDDDSDSDYGGVNVSNRKRGVSGVSGKSSGFKGMKMKKINKSNTKGIKSIGIKKKKKKKKKKKNVRDRSVTPKAKSVTPHAPKVPTVPKVIPAVNSFSFGKSIIHEIENDNNQIDEIAINISETQGLLNQDDDSNNKNISDNKLKDIDEHASI
eukprot:309260_1